VVVPSYPLTDFLLEPLHGLADVRIIEHPMPRRRWFSSLIRGLEVYVWPWLKKSIFFEPAYTAQLARIGPEDTVLFFAIENRKDLQIIRKFVRSRHQHVWLWNSVRSQRGDGWSRLWYLHWLRRSGMRAYTFNASDAQDGHIRLINQVYRHVAPAEIGQDPAELPRFDLYFLGIDKGRLPALQQLRAECDRAGLTTHFHVVADKRERYSDADRAWLASEWLPYRENLRLVAQSRALVELRQSGDSGQTIRSLEAAFFDRKLLTDNRVMRDSDLYHPSRIFILGQDDIAGLRAFLDTPLQPLAPRVLEAYDIVHWIRQFGNEPEASGS
jgi:hypothetical protein